MSKAKARVFTIAETLRNPIEKSAPKKMSGRASQLRIQRRMRGGCKAALVQLSAELGFSRRGRRARTAMKQGGGALEVTWIRHVAESWRENIAMGSFFNGIL